MSDPNIKSSDWIKADLKKRYVIYKANIKLLTYAFSQTLDEKLNDLLSKADIVVLNRLKQRNGHKFSITDNQVTCKICGFKFTYWNFTGTRGIICFSGSLIDSCDEIKQRIKDLKTIISSHKFMKLNSTAVFLCEKCGLEIDGPTAIVLNDPYAYKDFWKNTGTCEEQIIKNVLD